MQKITIIDDNFDFIQEIFNYISNYSKNNFMISNISTNGVEAYDYLKSNSPDIILLDLQMPKLNGVELLLKMKQENITSKIIIITGDSKLLHKLIELNISVYSIFLKPFDFEKLIECLQNIDRDNNDSNLENIIIEELETFQFNKSTPRI